MAELPLRVTVSQAVEVLDVRPDEVYRLIRARRLKATKLLGKWQIDRDSLLRHKTTRRPGRRMKEVANGTQSA